MSSDWQELTRLTGGAEVEVERVRLVGAEVAIEGRFTLPPLAQLAAEDQIFVAAFVRCHGSIKQMEKYFGVSYPTIKNRLNKIGSQLVVRGDRTVAGRGRRRRDSRARCSTGCRAESSPLRRRSIA